MFAIIWKQGNALPNVEMSKNNKEFSRVQSYLYVTYRKVEDNCFTAPSIPDFVQSKTNCKPVVEMESVERLYIFYLGYSIFYWMPMFIFVDKMCVLLSSIHLLFILFVF